MVHYKPIEGYPGYRVGDDGTIWRYLPGSKTERKRRPPRWKEVKPRKPNPGKRSRVLQAQLRKDGKRVEIPLGVVVLRAFSGPRPIGCAPFHFPDPDPSNCRADNLRWAPRGTTSIGRKRNVGTLNGRALLREEDVENIRRMRAEDFVCEEIAELYGISRSQVNHIVLGRAWAHVQ